MAGEAPDSDDQKTSLESSPIMVGELSVFASIRLPYLVAGQFFGGRSGFIVRKA